MRLESCERFLWYRFHASETRELLDRWGLSEQPLGILLGARGIRHERDMVERLEEDGIGVADMSDADPSEVVDALRGTEALAMLQPRLRARLEGFDAGGIADVILVLPDGQRPAVEIRDAKASRKDRPEHRIQIAFYALLLRRMAEEAGVPLGELTGSVWRIPAGPDDEQPVRFPLEPYEEAVRLLLEEHGVVRRVARARREDTRYHLTYKCDGCTYNALCMREAAETGSLALVPFLSSRDRAALERAGIRDVVSLAELKELPHGNPGERLLPAPGKDGIVRQLEAEWPVCTNLDLHIQRARQVARARDEAIEAKGWLYGSGFGTMPDRDAYPDLVQVFVDGQHDYLQDALYLAAALVVGPDLQPREVIELADGPPTTEEEGELIVRWVERLLHAVREVGGDRPVLHVYVYDRYDQRILLEALRRHLDRLSTIPDFFDLLTQTPALTQPMFTFLLDEVRDRKNLGILCHSLPLVAQRLGFGWSFDGADLRRIFRTRIFDNRAKLPDGRWYESAARFNSQIPLEYAYGAWGRLPDPDSEEDRPLIEPFRVSRDELLGFARARLHALWHVERSFRYKNRYIQKDPVRIPSRRPSRRQANLADVLVEFLHIEHHALLQSRLQHYAQPVERRVASGESILVEALEDASRGRCRFRYRFEEAGLDPALALAQMNPKEGDWMVLSRPDTERPWDILRGSIAILRDVGEQELTAELSGITFRGGTFRYGHERPDLRRGQRYVLDPLADDLAAHRYLDACQNADDNVLLRWIEDGSGGATGRRVRRAERDAVKQFREALAAAPTILTPTARQDEVIGDLHDRLLLVQGPPGTGKTHTIAWAILARAYAAVSTGRPFRALVCAMTHTAVDVILRALAEKLELLGEARRTRRIAKALDGLRLCKEVANAADVTVPEGVEAVGRSDASDLFESDLAVIGAVPGGVHRLLEGLSKPIEWSDKHVDLLVIDEASQVSLPAAVLAGAPLRESGQALIVGDHRQMPPILQHDWEREPLRTAQDTQVYRSTFEALLVRGFPTIGLDRSFRLHAMHASFLNRHIYRDDDVDFFSDLEHQLPQVDGLRGHVAAALHPDYPVVVVEHTEAASLKQNDVEIEILAPILRAAERRLGLDARDGVGVVVPHRAQRAALRRRFPQLADGIDTVERFQGGERDLIVVSATASDPEFVLAEASFLLNPNRLNVAFSRPRKKLIVVGSTTIFRLMPADMETFENALLWKELRYEFSADVLWEGRIAGVEVRISGRRAEPPSRPSAACTPTPRERGQR